MTGNDGTVRRRINGWHIDEMLELCEGIAGKNNESAITPALLDKLKELLRVAPCQQPGSEFFVWFDAEESNDVFTGAFAADDEQDHPTLADLFFGWFSFEQFLAMKLAQSIVTNPRHEKTLRELLALYKRTGELHGLLESFLAPDSVRKYYGTMLDEAQRTRFVLVTELILFAMMGETVAAAGASEHLPVCRKILDKLDRCFRADWIFCKEEYSIAARFLTGCFPELEDDVLDKAQDYMKKIRFMSPDGDYADAAELSCIRFFMMTRKLPVSALDDCEKPEYADVFAALISVAYYEYSVYNSSASCQRLSENDEEHDFGSWISGVAENVWLKVQREINEPCAVPDFHLPTPEKPISPPFAARSVLSHYGISFCRLASLFGGDAVRHVVMVGLMVSAEQTASFGELMSVKESTERCAKGTPDDVYYLSVIDMLARAYAQAMQADFATPEFGGTGEDTGIDAEQLEASLTLADENKKLREQIKQLNEALASANEDVPGIESLVDERVAAEVRAYKAEKDAQSAAKLRKKDERITTLEKRLCEALDAAGRVAEEADTLQGADEDEKVEAEENGNELSREDFEALEETLMERKVYVLGGHADWRKKMNKAFPYISIVPTDRYVQYADALANADIIIVNPYHCSHKAHDTVVSAAKKSGTRLIYVEKGCNPNNVARLLIKSLGVAAAEVR